MLAAHHEHAIPTRLVSGLTACHSLYLFFFSRFFRSIVSWCLGRRTKIQQAQELDFARRNREIQAQKEENERQLQMNDKALSDAALGVRTRDRQIINLGGKVRRCGIMYAAADVFASHARAGRHPWSLRERNDLCRVSLSFSLSNALSLFLSLSWLLTKRVLGPNNTASDWPVALC